MISVIRKRFTSRYLVLKKILFKDSIIVNYQMGKVGSSTVSEYLRLNNIFEWHIHRFYDTPVHNKRNKKKLFRYLDLLLLKYAKKRCKKLYIISGFREPIERDISMFFHNAEYYYGKEVFGNTRQLTDLFHKDFAIGDSSKWFEQELNRSFDVDVFSEEYDKLKGCSVFSSDKCDFFIYDMYKLNNLEHEIKRFFGIENYKLIKKNSADIKNYMNSYTIFKSEFRLSESELKSILDTDFMKHFYTEKQQEEFIKKWLRIKN